ncbi:MAG: hypothetical protein ACRBN8_11015 [Nannocystales bacterium]
MKHHRTKSHPARRISSVLLFALAAPAIGIGPLACDDGQDPHDMQMRSLDPVMERVPVSDPDLDPIDASELVGLTIEDLHAMSFNYDTYVMSERPTSITYTAPQIASVRNGGWPLHALQWKDYLTSTPQTSTFDIPAATAAISASQDFHSVEVDSAPALNALEAGVAFTGPDPAGDWMYINISSPAVAFAYAALVMHHWGSPVYVAGWLQHPAGSPNRVSRIALQELTFQLPPSVVDLFDSCGLLSTDPPSVALAAPPICANAMVLHHDEVTTWQESQWGTGAYTPFLPNYFLDPVVLASAMTTVGPVLQGNVVFDPPDEVTEEELEGVLVLAEALSEQLLIEGEDGRLVLLKELAFESMEG